MVGNWMGGTWWLGFGKFCYTSAASSYVSFFLLFLPLVSHSLLPSPLSPPLPKLHMTNGSGELNYLV